jgi:hypothetical protein
MYFTTTGKQAVLAMIIHRQDPIRSRFYVDLDAAFWYEQRHWLVFRTFLACPASKQAAKRTMPATRTVTVDGNIVMLNEWIANIGK